MTADRSAHSTRRSGESLFVRVVGQAQPESCPEDVDRIAFEDLDADCGHLTAAGYEIKGPTLFARGRAGYVRDPDGRMVELHASDVTYG